MYAHGLVIGKFYPPHLGHEYLIRTAAMYCRQVTVAVLGSSVESIPMQTRADWLRESFPTALHVRIVAELDDAEIDYDSPLIWDEHVDAMHRALAKAEQEYGHAPQVDAVFTSEAYGDELARRFSAAHVCLDQSRILYPVSGTAVRSNPAALWRWLSPAIHAGLALRIVLAGAESTGKTTLSRSLASALRARGDFWEHTEWVAEYGREYSANLLALLRARTPSARMEDIAWKSEDFTAIAAEQCRIEERAARFGGPVLICDTDAMATSIWHERYLGQPSESVTAITTAMPPRALYLLTNEKDVPFVDDGTRDGEHIREWMNDRFRQCLSAQNTPWLELHGSHATRLGRALEAIDEVFGNAWRFAPPFEQRPT